MVQAFAANTPNEPLDVRILSWTPGGDDHFFDPHVLHPLPKGGTIDAVPVAQEIAWRFVPREGVHHLLSRPLRRRVFRDVEMYDAAPFMGQDQQHEEQFVGRRRHDKEIQGNQGLCRKFCSGGHEGGVAPVRVGITRQGHRIVRPP
jgi:hypothetical protein